MQFRVLPLVVCLALVSCVLIQDVNGSPVDDKDDKDGDDEPSTQIESPLEANDGDDDGDDAEEFDYDDPDDEEEVEKLTPGFFDVDYNVKRPRPPTKEPEVACNNDNDDDDGDDDDEDDNSIECDDADQEKDLKPYEKYDGYNKWESRPLFVIIIGGLRWDYLMDSQWNMTKKTVGKMKAFNWIRKHGTTMKQVVPVFPPYDLPTWTSMATGLNPQTTGVTGDHMYNLKTRELFSRGDSLEGWWKEGEPIWSIAAKEGKNVSVLNWHDCNLPGKSLEKPKDCKPFNINSPMPTKQKLIQLFNQAFTKIHSFRYDLSIVYTDALKKAALRYGANSQEVMKTLADLDDVLQRRLSDIKNKKDRTDLKLNVLLLSDYGLNGRDDTTKIVLNDHLELEHVQYIIQRGGSAVIIPYALKTGDILNGVGEKPGLGEMLGVDAYVRDVDLEVPPLEYPIIPEELKYAGNAWTQDILLLAKPGFEIVIEGGHDKILPPFTSYDQELGSSGYHPNPAPPHIVPGRDKHKSKELRAREKVEADLYTRFAHMMKTVAFAWGPDFKKGYETDGVELVDMYQLMAFLLDVNPNPHHGNWDRVKSMLNLSGGESLFPSFLSLLLSSIVFLYVN